MAAKGRPRRKFYWCQACGLNISPYVYEAAQELLNAEKLKAHNKASADTGDVLYDAVLNTPEMARIREAK